MKNQDLSKLIILWGCGIVVLPGSSVWACPLCYSDTGKQVRAGIFNGDFLFNLAMTLFPFIVFTFIGLVLYYDESKNKK
ncbi:MAG: hypothetical protein Q7T03_10340 [Deltaproteobacteria bacterium]|nr:hypothetical protein [Deltaproteobacteria bacterium]